MKTVHVVHFGCNLTSEPLADPLADELRKRLADKGLQCYTREYDEMRVVADARPKVMSLTGPDRLDALRRNEMAYVPCAESDIPRDVRFDVPPEHQGQAIEIAYGGYSAAPHTESDPYMRRLDRSVRPAAYSYYRLEWTKPAKSTDSPRPRIKGGASNHA